MVFVLTVGTLVTTRTETFLDGSSPSSLRMSLPYKEENDSQCYLFTLSNIFLNDAAIFYLQWELTDRSDDELTLISSPVNVQ